MKTNAHGILAAAILAAGTANANPIIEDTFSNGIPEDTDEVAGYWVARGNTGFSIVESDGKVTMKTVQGDNKTARWTEIVSAEPDPNMNFLKRPVTFSAELGAFSGTTVDKKKQALRFSVFSGSGDSWRANNFFRFEIMRNFRVWFVEKVDGVTTILVGEKHTDPVAKFALRLDADSYELVLTDPNGNERTFTGTHSLAKGSWHANGPHVGLTAYKNKEGNSDGNASVEIKRFEVVAEEP
jgi:hypothetical protein